MSLTEEQERVLTWATEDVRNTNVSELLAIVKALREENALLRNQNGQQVAMWSERIAAEHEKRRTLQQQVAEQQKEIQRIRSELSYTNTVSKVRAQEAELERLRALLRKVANGASGFGVAEEIEAAVKENKS